MGCKCLVETDRTEFVGSVAAVWVTVQANCKWEIGKIDHRYALTSFAITVIFPSGCQWGLFSVFPPLFWSIPSPSPRSLPLSAIDLYSRALSSLFGHFLQRQKAPSISHQFLDGSPSNTAENPLSPATRPQFRFLKGLFIASIIRRWGEMRTINQQ